MKIITGIRKKEIFNDKNTKIIPTTVIITAPLMMYFHYILFTGIADNEN